MLADLSVVQGIKVSLRLWTELLTIDELVAISSTDLESFDAQLAQQLGIGMHQLVLAGITVHSDGVYFKLSILVSSALDTLKAKILDHSIFIRYGPDIIVADSTSFDLSSCESNCATAAGACVSAHSCQVCNAGYVPNHQTGDCDVCGSGNYANGTACVQCADNTFDSDSRSATACIACGINTFSAAGSTGCLPCPFGTHRDVGRSICEPCLCFLCVCMCVCLSVFLFFIVTKPLT
jgi:hypothetical protein